VPTAAADVGDAVTAERVALIRSKLEAAFAPDELEVVDDSHRHAGHAGARDGRGHFQVRILSRRFAGKRTIERHRMIYAALGSLMQTDIHALGLEALSPDDSKSTKGTQ
jgi:BolA family transcriptional regulator, general stress-responsive regulator